MTEDEAANIIASVIDALNNRTTYGAYLQARVIVSDLLFNYATVDEAIVKLDGLATAFRRTDRSAETAATIQRAADVLRFETLPKDGPGAVLVPLVREASEKGLYGARAMLERIARQLNAGRITKQRAIDGLSAVSERASDGSAERQSVLLINMARRALEH